MLKRIKAFIKKYKTELDLLLGIGYIIGISYYAIGGIYIAKYLISKFV